MTIHLLTVRSSGRCWALMLLSMSKHCQVSWQRYGQLHVAFDLVYWPSTARSQSCPAISDASANTGWQCAHTVIKHPCWFCLILVGRCLQEHFASSCPVILIPKGPQQQQGTAKKRPGPSGWSLVLPAHWVMPFWLALLHRSVARAAAGFRV